jgi:hypothetical protein
MAMVQPFSTSDLYLTMAASVTAPITDEKQALFLKLANVKVKKKELNGENKRS